MYSQIAANKRKTWAIMFFFMVLVGFVSWVASSYLFNAPLATFAVLGAALVYTLFSYFGAAKMATSMSGAKEIEKRDHPTLYNIVENLAITDGMPMPKVYIIEDEGLNAFATGRNPENAIVAATTGLIEKLDKKELEGVMAHELGHVKNYDIRVTMIAFALTTVISVIVDILMRVVWLSPRDDRDNNGMFMILGFAVAILAPIVAGMIRMAVSRRREYLADATGALTTRYPEGLASALKKIEGNSSLKRQHTATAHLFISNPIKSKSVAALFSTHPPIEDRVSKLMEMTDKV